VQHDYNKDNDTSDSYGKTGVMDQDEPNPNPANPTSASKVNGNGSTSRNAAHEARQLLDEIAGLDSDRRSPRPARPELAKTVRTILLLPFLIIWAIVKLIVAPLRQADFKLAGEMRKFLRNPGHFFWFNRVAPELAAQHFGTSSTDAMTNHARRYGAHIAMLLLAVVVIVFGGFSGLTHKIVSAYADTPTEFQATANLVVVEDSREIYASAVAGNDSKLPRRVETVVIKDGDTLPKIAAAHSISLETLLYANNLVEPDSPLTPGQKLVVPPTTGMLHIGNPGDTIGSIANKYGVDPQVIINYKFNNLEGADNDTPLKSLQEVMVPGGSLPQREKLYLYTVRSGDTLKSVAAKFGLNTDTILDNNELDNGLRIGQQIRILPVDGIIYKVQAGDTLDGIAQYLGTSAENIINFKPNNVARGVKLVPDSSIIVPGGDWPPPPPPKPAEPTPTPKPAPAAPASNKGSAPAVAPLPKVTQKPAPVAQKPAPAVQKKPAPAPAPTGGKATGSMIWPMRGVITTYFGQRIWYGIHAGLDISQPCGARVVAADGGTVIEAGWSQYGYGITALINHGNGFVTRYGHFSRIAVSLGQRVSRGQLVGYEGTTGNSTGCHLHFEVKVNGNLTNPLRWLP
jgi:murein DD-endopeptidase MepM/ murein hydrolase activator NlpD